MTEPGQFVSAPTTDTLIRQTRRLLRSLAETQADLERFVGLIEHQAHDQIGDDGDERE
jgi:hypothetical protein